MIYEMRTDTFRIGANARDFLEKVAPVIDQRNSYSMNGAFWSAEMGPLNQVIHIWPYESLKERSDVRVAVSQSGVWPPRGIEGLLGEDNEILSPAPFMRPWGDVQELGSVYEIRTYTIKPGNIPDMIDRWGEVMHHREKHSPLAACWYTEVGDLLRWIHVWPYANLDERTRIRAEAAKDPHWPPGTREFIVRQESRIVIPAPFSTMR